jgi:hypothetical protein
MSMVARYSAALAASAVLTAFAFGLVAGASADLLLQPYYWVVSISLAGLAGLGMGNGNGSANRRSTVVRMAPPGVRPATMAIAA